MAKISMVNLRSSLEKDIKMNLEDYKKIELNDAELKTLLNSINNSGILKNLYKYYVLLKQAAAMLALKTQGNSISQKKDDFEDNDLLLIKEGARWIFELRKMLTGESLIFSIGGTYFDENGQAELREKRISQEELFGNIFKNLTVDISNGAVRMTSAIMSLDKKKTLKNNLGRAWAKIEDYAFNVEENKEEYYRYTRGGKISIIYHKSDKDTNVYYKWVTDKGGKRTRTFYYLRKGSEVKNLTTLRAQLAYDRGWLYQWAKILTKSSEGRTALDDFVNDGSNIPLHHIMWASTSYRENIPGVKGGDWGLEQYKHDNDKIISINNIYNIITGHRRIYRGKFQENLSYKGIIPSLELFFANIARGANIENSLEQLIQNYQTIENADVAREAAKTLSKNILDELQKSVKT